MAEDFAPDDDLSEVEARQRLAQDGPNELPTSKPRGVLRLLRDVVSEPMFLLLVACGAIYMVLGDRNEALMLLGFVCKFADLKQIVASRLASFNPALQLGLDHRMGSIEPGREADFAIIDPVTGVVEWTVIGGEIAYKR